MPNFNANASEVEALKQLLGGTWWYSAVSGGNQLVKSGAGYVESVTVGNVPLTSAFVMYDAVTSGSGQFFKLNAGISANTFFPQVQFDNGLVISCGSVLDNITVSYQ